MCYARVVLRRLATTTLALLFACSDATASSPDAAVTAGPDALVHADAAAAPEPDASVAEDATPLPDASATEDAAPSPDADAEDATALPDASAAEDAASTAEDAATTGPMELLSPDLPAGAEIPALHTCSGRDIQPELDFANVPAGTQSLAVVLIDDSIDYVHWIALDIPPATTSLAQGASDARALPAGTREIPAYGTQYRGPCPPNTHTYTFRLYALPTPTTTYSWRRTITGAHVDAAFAGHLAEARLTRSFTP